MSFPRQVHVLITPELVHIANKIARAADYWGNGGETFGKRFNSDGNTYMVTYSQEAFAMWVQIARSNPEQLHADVAEHWAVRGLEGAPPTLEDCELFLDNAEIYVNGEVAAHREKFIAHE